MKGLTEDMRTKRRTLRGGLVVVAALLAGLLIAACGGSSSAAKTSTSKNSASTTTTKSATAARTAFTTCLKQHGVTLPAHAGSGFPFRHGTSTTGAPPTGTTGAGGFGPGGFGGGGFAAGGFANSKFAKAFKDCAAKLGKSGFGFGHGGFRPGAGHVAPHFSTTALKSYVACIRTHGYPSMPEPNTSGKGAVFPASVEKSAAFEKASAACVSILRRAFVPPGSSTTTPATTATT